MDISSASAGRGIGRGSGPRVRFNYFADHFLRIPQSFIRPRRGPWTGLLRRIRITNDIAQKV